MLLQTKTRKYEVQNIEFRLQSSYCKNATIHRGCICVDPCRHTTFISGGRRQSNTATLGHKLALYVDDQFINEHVDGARHVTAVLP